MGITFTCGPDATIAMVEKVQQGSAAEQAGIEIGDILFLLRGRAYRLRYPSGRRELGGTETHWRRIDDFRCLGQPFDVQMAAFNSTAIVDAGFKHRIVRAMFRRTSTPTGDCGPVASTRCSAMKTRLTRREKTPKHPAPNS